MPEVEALSTAYVVTTAESDLGVTTL